MDRFHFGNIAIIISSCRGGLDRPPAPERPATGGGIDGLQAAELQASQEVLLDVMHGFFGPQALIVKP